MNFTKRLNVFFYSEIKYKYKTVVFIEWLYSSICRFSLLPTYKCYLLLVYRQRLISALKDGYEPWLLFSKTALQNSL
jgi:hypothetical protein